MVTAPLKAAGLVAGLILATAAGAAEQPPAGGGAATPSPGAPSTAEPAAPADNESFALSPATGDHLRIDRRTGRVSICSSKSGDWRCTLVPEDREAYEAEIAELRSENDRLKRQLADAEKRWADSGRQGEWFGPDERKKLDEFLDFSDHAMRRFFDMVEDLKRDLDAPDRI